VAKVTRLLGSLRELAGEGQTLQVCDYNRDGGYEYCDFGTWWLSIGYKFRGG